MKSGKVDEELLEIAEEAAMNVADMDVPLRAYLRAAIAAVALPIQRAERERCAGVALASEIPEDCGPHEAHGRNMQALGIAAAIRALD